MKSQHDYLQDIVDYLDTITTFTSDGRETFLSDRKTQFAVIRAYEVIGEVAKRLPEDFRDSHAEIDWQRLINFRDFLAHNYERVLLQNLWVAIEDLPKLRATVDALLRSLPDDESPQAL